MSRQYKPRAYLEKVCNGWFMLEPCYTWVAREYWGSAVAYGHTRKECEAECRYKGYVPVRE